MSFSTHVKPVLDDAFDDAVHALTLPEGTIPETRALFTKGQEAVIALARELPRFGTGADVGFTATISGHAAPDPPGGWSPHNSLAISVAETMPPPPSAQDEAEAAA